MHSHPDRVATARPDAAPRALDQFGADGLDKTQALASVEGLLDQPAYTMAVADLFQLSSWLFFVPVALVWLVQPSATAVVAGGEH